MFINAQIIGRDERRTRNPDVKRGDKSFVMSRSELVGFSDNPTKWLAGAYAFEESKAMDFGSLLDCLLTQPDSLESKFVVSPDIYPVFDKKGVPTGETKPWNNNANFCKDFNSDHEARGLTVVSQKMYADARKAEASMKSNEAIADLIECSAKQVLIVADWKDDATGLVIPFASLLDLVPPASHAEWGKTLADIKTARDGNPAKWARVCDDSGYDIQAAIYMDIHFAATGEDRTDFVHVIQENTFPFHVVTPPPALSVEFLQWGRSKYTRALSLYCKCLANEVWPGYDAIGIQYGNTQIIGPEDCWNYRKCAGMTEFKMPEPARVTEPSFDILP